MPTRRLALLLASLAVVAAAPPEPSPAMAGAAARRFPQPIRAGALIGRAVLQPTEAQPILGHVAVLARRPDGGVTLFIRTGGTLGFGARLVAVPLEAVAVLGEYVALMAYTPAQLASLPTADPPAATLPADATLNIGIVRPFH